MECVCKCVRAAGHRNTEQSRAPAQAWEPDFAGCTGAAFHCGPTASHHPLPARSSPEEPPARDGICFSYHSFFFPSSTSSLCLCWSSGQQQSDESNSSTQKQPRVPVGSLAMVVCSSPLPWHSRALPQLHVSAGGGDRRGLMAELCTPVVL